MTIGTANCSFCGRHETETATGCLHHSKIDRDIAICPYCARSAVRSFGELPDAGDAVVPFERRAQAETT